VEKYDNTTGMINIIITMTENVLPITSLVCIEFLNMNKTTNSTTAKKMELFIWSL